jgi:hypothetical protein
MWLSMRVAKNGIAQFTIDKKQLTTDYGQLTVIFDTPAGAC